MNDITLLVLVISRHFLRRNPVKCSGNSIQVPAPLGASSMALTVEKPEMDSPSELNSSLTIIFYFIEKSRALKYVSLFIGM